MKKETKNAIEIKKIRAADIAYWDLSAARYSSAIYGIFSNEILVGVIRNDSDGSYRAAPRAWVGELVVFGIRDRCPRNVAISLSDSLRDARAKAERFWKDSK